MSAERWQEENSKYLSASLEWLRLRFQVLEETSRTPETPVPAPARNRVRGSQVRSSETAARAADEAAVELARLASAMQPAPALCLLAERLGMSAFERNVLLLAISAELDVGDTPLAGGASAYRAAPSFALAMRLFEDPAWDALSPERPLRYWRLVELVPADLAGVVHSTLRADERIVNFCRGLNHLDERLAASLSEMPVRLLHLDLPPSQREAVTLVTAAWQVKNSTILPLVQLLGTDGTSKQVVALEACRAQGRRLYRLAADLLPTAPNELLAFARLWQRESHLTAAALYVDADDLDGRDGESTAPVRRLLANLSGYLLLATREPSQRISRPLCSIHVMKPTAVEQRELWTANLPCEEGSAPVLAQQFDLNVAEIQQVIETALSISDDSSTLQDSLWELCREQTQPRLDLLAQRLDPRATWKDMVLPRAETDLLRQIAAQVSRRATVYGDWGFGERMNRGLGITALFAGESGTGKTMAAEVLANELRLGLYRIDLSAVVSKYIGETEKNLRRLFDAAENGGSILFFDEADALFGKRSEVRDSHDRYANIEVNYLLQRMEAFRGLAILATNMRSSLDSAFTRRLRFVVTFPFPSVSDRKLMWQKAFPSQTPTQDLDFGRLARLNLTGGNIHSAAINAAFLAADRQRPITMAEALAAARNELLKLDQPIVEAEFHWFEPKGVA